MSEWKSLRSCLARQWERPKALQADAAAAVVEAEPGLRFPFPTPQLDGHCRRHCAAVVAVPAGCPLFPPPQRKAMCLAAEADGPPACAAPAAPVSPQVCCQTAPPGLEQLRAFPQPGPERRPAWCLPVLGRPCPTACLPLHGMQRRGAPCRPEDRAASSPLPRRPASGRVSRASLRPWRIPSWAREPFCRYRYGHSSAPALPPTFPRPAARPVCAGRWPDNSGWRAKRRDVSVSSRDSRQ